MECEAVNFVMNQNVENFECIVAKLFQYTCSVMINNSQVLFIFN